MTSDMTRRRFALLRLPAESRRDGGRGDKERIRGPRPSSLAVEEVEFTHGEALDARRGGHLVLPSIPMALVQPNSEGDAEALAEEPGAEYTWGLRALGADESQHDGRDVKVALLDSGIDLEHPAFSRLQDEERIVCKNFAGGPTSEIEDVSGHGTHCAGTLCGGAVDGIRIGVAPGIERLLVGKVFGPDLTTSTTIILKAIHWAISNGADIISLSLSINFAGGIAQMVKEEDLPPEAAISRVLEDYRAALDVFRELNEYLQQQQILLVAATGNESRRDKYTIHVAPPAGSAGVLSVGALERREGGLRVAPFSNTGPSVVAPGVRVLSAQVGGGLIHKSGTSMATPHVAGIAALWLQYLKENDELDQDNVLTFKMLKQATLDPLEVTSRAHRDVGAGLVRPP